MRRLLAAVSVIALSVALGACTLETAPTSTTEVALPAPTERAAAVRFDVATAELKLAGGAAGLLEGKLSYPSSEASPTLDVGSKETTSGKVVTVGLEQNAGGVQLGGPGSVWDLKLNGGLPTDLDVASASGKLDLDLGIVDVKDLAVTSRSGAASVKLTGPHPSMSRLAIKTDSGKLDVDASGEFPAVEGFKVSTESGELTLNVSGTWRKTFAIDVRSRSGAVTLVLPRDCNVQAMAVTSSGRISAEGFELRETPEKPPAGTSGAVAVPAGPIYHRNGDKYRDATLLVFVRSDSGAITLELPEKK